MPIYEFFCKNNQRIYSFLARSLRYSDKAPRCPDNPRWKMEKLISGFAITGRAKEETTPLAQPGVDDAALEKATHTLEREFGNLSDADSDNPRAIAAMMRRMGELTGKQMPAELNEVMSRLERGDNPEVLEEEYGDIFEKFADSSDEETQSPKSIKQKRLPKITRDPTLYEFSDYSD